MVGVDAQDVLELSAACNQKPVETFAADRADPALGDRVRLRRPKGCADDFDVWGALTRFRVWDTRVGRRVVRPSR
jgi:hypothetical protein